MIKIKTVDLESVKSKATAYHNSGKYSCAESVFLTLVETFDIPLHKDFYGVASGFAGGGACGSLCGASSGAILVVGLIFGGEYFGKDKMSNKARILAKEINQSFIDEQGGAECRVILENFQMGSVEQHNRCINISGDTAKLAARIICRELNYEIN